MSCCVFIYLYFKDLLVREKFITAASAKHADSMSPENPETCAEEDVANTLRSRIIEQSSLIFMLKDRADETLLRYQAQLKINSNLEEQAANYQENLDRVRKRAEMLEERSSDLASSNKAIISSIEEHKNQHVLLKMEYERQQLEKDSQFSQKLQEKELLVQKLTEDIELLTEKLTKNENEYREKLAESESKLKEKVAQHQVKEASLHIQFNEVQRQQREAVGTCKDLKLKLERTKEHHASEENSMKERIESLTEENEKLLKISTEKGKVEQDKHEEIQELKTKWEEEKNARIKAEYRFELEAEAVNADERVKSLQAALSESLTKVKNLTVAFDAFREHSAYLIKREKDLNKIYFQMKK